MTSHWSTYQMQEVDESAPLAFGFRPDHRKLLNEEITILFKDSFKCSEALLTMVEVSMDIPYEKLFSLMSRVTLECLVANSRNRTFQVVQGSGRTWQYRDLRMKVFLEGLRLSGLTLISDGH